MPDYTEADFVWYRPGKKDRCVITITRGTSMNLNTPLCRALPANVRIGFRRDDHALALSVGEPTDFRVTKSGMVHAPALVADILSAGVTIPAHFTVEKQGELWIARLDAQTQPVLSPEAQVKPTSKRNFKSRSREADR